VRRPNRRGRRRKPSRHPTGARRSGHLGCGRATGHGGRWARRGRCRGARRGDQGQQLGTSGGAATGVETWAPGVELAASADVDDPLHGGYASTISSIQDLELGDAGEAWLLYNRLQGTVSAASRINIYLRHRHAGADLGTWDAPELVAEVGVGWSAIRRRPRCGWHMRPPVT
jgi:hypothetical protein